MTRPVSPSILRRSTSYAAHSRPRPVLRRLEIAPNFLRRWDEWLLVYVVDAKVELDEESEPTRSEGQCGIVNEFVVVSNARGDEARMYDIVFSGEMFQTEVHIVDLES